MTTIVNTDYYTQQKLHNRIERKKQTCHDQNKIKKYIYNNEASSIENSRKKYFGIKEE